MNGNHAYLTRSDEGMYIIDVSQPSTPTLVSFYNTIAHPIRLAIAENYAYVVDQLSNLHILEPSATQKTLTKSDPINLIIYKVVFKTWWQQTAWFMSRMEGLDYTSRCEQSWQPGRDSDITRQMLRMLLSLVTTLTLLKIVGLRILDVSQPDTPTQVSLLDSIGSASRIALSGDFAYLIVDHNLSIIDISNPFSPVGVKTYNIGYSIGMTVSGSYVYVLKFYDLPKDGSWNEVDILDVSHANAPFWVGSYILSSTLVHKPMDIAISGNIAYIASGDLVVIDVSTPDNLVKIGSYQADAEDVALAGNYACATTASGGVIILAYAPPHRIHLPLVQRGQ